MLTLYRRHTRACGQKDRYYRRCKCPVWVEGTTNAGDYLRHSLKLTSWERGEEKRRELELGPDAFKDQVKTQFRPEPITVRAAAEKFRKECEARSLGESTLRKYATLAKQIREFADTVRLPERVLYGARARVPFVLERRRTGVWKKARTLARFLPFRDREWLDRGVAREAFETTDRQRQTDVAF